MNKLIHGSVFSIRTLFPAVIDTFALSCSRKLCIRDARSLGPFILTRHLHDSVEAEPLSDNDVVNPKFVNRNPRNLEMMNIARKSKGWKYQYPPRTFYHRLVFEQSHRYIRAYVEHSSGKHVVSASTKEVAISRFLYSTRDVAAAENIGHVVAQRCKESGITNMELLIPTDRQFSDKFLAFHKAVESSGLSLCELPEEVPEYEPGIDYDNAEHVEGLRHRQTLAERGGPETRKQRMIESVQRRRKSRARRNLNLNSNKGYSMQGRLLNLNMMFHRHRK